MMKHKWQLICLALIGLIGVVAGAVYAAGGDSEVRISAFRHDDGRVEVGLQQRGADGGWGERTLPEARFLRPDQTGRWLNSSPIAVKVADAMTGETKPLADAPAELYCVVHHGADDDPFWSGFNLVAGQNAHDLGLTNVEISGYPVVADQAAAIMDCIDRGALGIASTIPDPDGLRDALLAARHGGAFVLTFNSGVDFAAEVGSLIHYGLDDRFAGELAGREFNEAGLSGAVLCVIHERVNVGLQDRCDGLERVYEGPVERVQLPAGGLADPEAARTAIGEALAEHQAAGVLVLNPELIDVAIDTVRLLQSDALVGSVGRADNSVDLVYGGQLQFVIGDGVLDQASHVTLALKNIDASPSLRAMLQINPTQSAETSIMLIRPLVLDEEFINNLPEGWMEQSCALSMQLDPDSAPSFCDR